MIYKILNIIKIDYEIEIIKGYNESFNKKSGKILLKAHYRNQHESQARCLNLICLEFFVN